MFVCFTWTILQLKSLSIFTHLCYYFCKTPFPEVGFLSQIKTFFMFSLFFLASYTKKIYRLRKSCWNSTKSSHVPFIYLPRLAMPYTTIVYYQNQEGAHFNFKKMSPSFIFASFYQLMLSLVGYKNSWFLVSLPALQQAIHQIFASTMDNNSIGISWWIFVITSKVEYHFQMLIVHLYCFCKFLVYILCPVCE